MSVWDLSRLDTRWRDIVESAIAATDFDFERLVPGLRAAVGRDRIPVEVADLSRWNAAAQAHEHEGRVAIATDASFDDAVAHARAHGDAHDSDAHVIAGELNGRRAALGLAWYSGKVSLEQNMINDRTLAQEVFLAEGAHMVDFFMITPAQRQAIFDAYHTGTGHTHGPGDTSHGWFEETGNNDYWSWVGESFMSGFMRAFAPSIPMVLEPRQPWAHRTTAQVANRVREILSPPVEPDPDTDTDDHGHTRVFGSSRGKTYHDSHRGIAQDIWWDTEHDAVAAGRRPCGVCKPPQG